MFAGVGSHLCILSGTAWYLSFGLYFWNCKTLSFSCWFWSLLLLMNHLVFLLLDLHNHYQCWTMIGFHALSWLRIRKVEFCVGKLEVPLRTDSVWPILPAGHFMVVLFGFNGNRKTVPMKPVEDFDVQYNSYLYLKNFFKKYFISRLWSESFYRNMHMN